MTTRDPKLTVGFLPWWPQNPYQLLLKRELNALGVRVIGNPPLSLLRILLGRDGLDIVHVHWPHGLYKSFGQMLYVLAALVAYRVLKNNIVWTVHELRRVLMRGSAEARPSHRCLISSSNGFPTM